MIFAFREVWRLQHRCRVIPSDVALFATIARKINGEWFICTRRNLQTAPEPMGMTAEPCVEVINKSQWKHNGIAATSSSSYASEAGPLLASASRSAYTTRPASTSLDETSIGRLKSEELLEVSVREAFANSGLALSFGNFFHVINNSCCYFHSAPLAPWRY